MNRLGFLSLLFVTACFAPKLKEGGFVCGADGLCPSGMHCGTDGHCYSGSLDMDSSTSLVGNGQLGDLTDLGSASGNILCNTETGEWLLNGSSVLPANLPGFVHITQTNGPPLALWQFRNLTIPPTVTLQPSSSSVSVAVFAASQTMAIEGAISWAGFGGVGGGPGQVGQTRMSGVASAGGGGSGTIGAGGGGAGYAANGQSGGGPMGEAGTAGLSYGSPTVVPIHVGSGGGGGAGAMGGNGGNGGGAVVLLAHQLTLGATIDVSGTPGASGSLTAASGGGGGGSGGSIVLSGDAVLLDTGHNLVAHGGKGGALGMNGFAGGDGAEGRIWIGTPTLTFTNASAPMSSPASKLSPTPLTSFAH